MITSTLVIPAIAITTLATIISIGLGFLPRPSRATAIWAAAFATAMVGAYVWLAQDFIFPDQLRAIGSGLAIAPMSLLYSGLRAFRGCKRQYLPVSLVFVVATPLLLFATVQLGVYAVVFRVIFCITAAIAAMIFLELVRLGPRLRDEAIPLMGVSLAFVLFAVITATNGILIVGGRLPEPDGLDFLRSINLIGMCVYVVCALVTTLLLTVHSDSTSISSLRGFELTARKRLDRARASDDHWWSLLDIRLDDPDDIRVASSTAAFNAACQKFARDIDSVLPADADIESMNRTSFVVLVPRPHGGVRELITELLERVSAPDEMNSMPIRLSASIGWASVATVGYDYDDLVNAASTAAHDAYVNGGDRWVRVRGEGE